MRAWMLVVVVMLVAGRAAAEATPAEAAGGEDEAPAAEAMTLVRVSTDRPGAEVAIDGHACGQTPALVEVAPGRHEVHIARDGRVVRSIVVAVEGETVEVAAAFPESPLAPATPVEAAERRAPPAAQARDEEGPRAQPPAEPQEPYYRRIPIFPWAELQIHAGAFSRSFGISIDPMVDVLRRPGVGFATGVVGVFGFRGVIFPAAGARNAAFRGLGVEGGYAFAFGLHVRSERADVDVTTSFYEADVGLLYRLTLGRPDRGATLVFRFGWHRTEFDVGEVGNDLVPPFTYDTVRLGVGAEVPIFSRFILADLHAAYLPVAGIHGNRDYGVLDAYADADGEYSAHGGEVRLGLIGRLGRVELGVHWHGRWFSSEFSGQGAGFGLDPTTRIDRGGDGILTVGSGSDSYQQFQFSMGYRF